MMQEAKVQFEGVKVPMYESNEEQGKTLCS
jgi:hypothetical protein